MVHLLHAKAKKDAAVATSPISPDASFPVSTDATLPPQVATQPTGRGAI